MKRCTIDFDDWLHGFGNCDPASPRPKNSEICKTCEYFREKYEEVHSNS